MKILALELSSKQGSVAWIENGREPFLRIFANDRKHSGSFFENLQLCSREFGAPDTIVVGLGPGSYAGVRIAIATAIGLRAAFGTKLIGIPSVLGVDTAASEYSVIGDARRASFFFGRVSEGRMVEGPSLHSSEELKTKMMERTLPTYASEPLPQFPLVMLAYPLARRLAELARDRIGEIGDRRSLEPIYLREPHITVPKNIFQVGDRSMKSEATHRCWVEIDQSALRHNAAVVRERLGAGVEMLAVVKANGYGHGLKEVAKALAQDAQFFGVANLEEATILRRDVSQPLIILGPALPEERAPIVEGGFMPSVSTWEEAEEFNRVARRAPVAINFVIDTGMGRMGVPQVEAMTLFKKIAALPNIEIHSVSTHLPVSNEDADFTRAELAQFAEIVRKLRAEFPGAYKTHVLQSAGTLAFADPPFDIVRAGIMLYGISPLPEFQKLLRPALTWKTRISLVRDMPAGHGISYGRTFITPREMRVATLSAGYADGYPRHLSNREAAVLVHGRRCALLGRVTMDLMMIDVSHIDGAKAGDEVVLLGRQGDEEISATELAERANTISWEITTRIGSRVRRVYV